MGLLVVLLSPLGQLRDSDQTMVLLVLPVEKTMEMVEAVPVPVLALAQLTHLSGRQVHPLQSSGRCVCPRSLCAKLLEA
jgi:hypothetical protein